MIHLASVLYTLSVGACRRPFRVWQRVLALRCLWSVFLLGLCAPSCGFGQPKQEPLSSVRERYGTQRLQTNAASTVSIFVKLSQHEKELLAKVSSAGKKRNWQAVKNQFSSYRGDGVPLYNAAMHAAIRCQEYQEGALIYQRCRKRCTVYQEPTFAAALKIYGKLGDSQKVRQVWTDTLKLEKLNEVLAAARIDAAADSGDVETAAEVLDLMVDSGLEIDLVHVNSAIRSCWGWHGKGRRATEAAKYFFNLLPRFRLRPDIVAFSTLIGALQAGQLDDILSAYAEMKSLQIQPNSAFAETYLVTLLQKDRKGILRTVDDAVDFLRPKPQERLQAARKALSHFDSAEVKLTALSSIIQKGLKRLYP